MSRDILFQGNFFVIYIITDDETWIYAFDVKTVEQSSEWCLKDGTRTKTDHVKVTKKIEVMLTVFFDCRGVAHY